MSTNVPVIALEGMPRSGKTSSLSQLKIDLTSKEGIRFLDEIYFSEDQLNLLTDKRGTLAESKWFIDQEVKRRINMKQSNTRQISMVLADRTYLSTLAYCYARSKVNNSPDEYNMLIEYFISRTHEIPSYDLVIIFENKISTILNRRDDKREEDKEYWHDQNFMKHFKEFYRCEIYKFYQSKIVRLNVTNLNLDEIRQKISNLIDPYL